MRLADKVKKTISLSQYYQRYIDKDVDLDADADSGKETRPCKIHGEKEGGSFSYKKSKGIVSCFGKCHMFGADVIGLHQKWFKLNDRDTATKHLADLIGVKEDITDLKRPEAKINKLLVDKTVYLNRAESLVKDIDSCIELDYLMSQLKNDSEIIVDLKSFIERHGGKV